MFSNNWIFYMPFTLVFSIRNRSFSEIILGMFDSNSFVISFSGVMVSPKSFSFC